MEQIKRFVDEFFRNLKCDLIWENEILVVKNVPKSFEDLFGKVSPYRLSFVEAMDGFEFVGKGSPLIVAIRKYLEGAGKATLLRIDFSPRGDSGEFDVEKEICKRFGFRNCELDGLSKSYKNNSFSRFSFVSSFNYLNESERVISEVYVHEGKVVEGDLSEYRVLDARITGVGEQELKVDSERVKRDYSVAKEKVVELVRDKQEEVSRVLKEKVESEIRRVGEHYDKALKELGGDLASRLEKIHSLELELRSCEKTERDVLRKKLVRLKEGLVKAGNDEVLGRVLKEREMTIRDVMHKYSLNVSRKLMNTTVIYYPIYIFKLKLKSSEVAGRRSQVAGRILEVSYDPLTRVFGELDCEVCLKSLEKISLCEAGHICCEDCIDKCGDCGGVFCLRCLKRRCKVCGKRLCKNCVKMCMGCGSVVCGTHMRKDSVSGEERCVDCLRACLRCRDLSDERYFGVAKDGSKVCGKCLGAERLAERLGVRD
jgi:hypothetical protein